MSSGGESEPTTNEGEGEGEGGGGGGGGAKEEASSSNVTEDEGSLVKKRVRYRLLRELGQRMQRTYAAMRSEGGGSSTLVVTQRFSSGGRVDEERVASSDALRAIAHEALLLKKNWHPNIARVRHVDAIDDNVFIATDFLDGVTLEEFLALANAKSLALHPEEPMISHAVVARIFLDVLAGLSALHALREDGSSTPLGAYHAALGPSNVVIGKDGVARIIATFRERPPRLITAKSESLGYASPEMLLALTDKTASKPDLKSDIFAVGVMLWEALSEKRLYAEGDPTLIAQRQRSDEPAKPNARLADVVMQALAFDPFVRFRTAQDMASSIRSLAGSIATGSALAQLVNDLAGDRIKARRLEIQGGPLGATAAARKSVNPAIPTLPRRRESGSIPRVQAPTVKAQTPSAPFSPGAVTPRAMPSAPASSPAPTTSSSSSPPTSESRLPAVSTPPKRMTPPPGRVRRLTPREFRAVTPSSESSSSNDPLAPDVATSYAPRKAVVAHAVPPAPTPPITATAPLEGNDDHDDDDDEFPGPRPSTPDTEYLNVLSRPAPKKGAAEIEAEEELGADDLLEEEDSAAGAAIASPFIVANDEIEPEVAQFAREVVISETSVAKELPREPDSEPEPLPEPVWPRQHSSTRTPFVVDVRPSSRPRPSSSTALGRPGLSPTMRKVIPIVALMAVLSIALLLAGAAIISRRTPQTTTQATTPPPNTTTTVDPPSTVIVAPPPAAVDVLPSASASPLKR